MIPFAMKTAAETAKAPKIAPSPEGMWNASNTWLLGHNRVILQTVSLSVYPFLQSYERDQQTNTQTDGHTHTHRPTPLLRL